MTRSLPWKKDGGARPRGDVLRADSPARTPIASRSGTPKGTPLGAQVASASKTKSVARLSLSTKRGTASPLCANDFHANQRKERSPSTSPPPEPPVESFMVEGAENDDRWRMVEDEFLSVANTFTVHLHAAEYHRLKSLAKEQNADTINSISRPVTGVMTSSVKRRQDAVARLAKQRRGLKRARSNVDEPQSDDDDRRPWAGTSLQGLLDSPRKKSLLLTSVTSVLSATRAAAGYQGNSPSKGSRRFIDALSETKPHSNPSQRQMKVDSETSDDSEDLDGPVYHHQTVPTSSSATIPHRNPHDQRGGGSLNPELQKADRLNRDTSPQSPDQPESDNPDDGLFLRDIKERRERLGVRGRLSLVDVTIKQEKRD